MSELWMAHFLGFNGLVDEVDQDHGRVKAGGQYFWSLNPGGIGVF